MKLNNENETKRDLQDEKVNVVLSLAELSILYTAMGHASRVELEQNLEDDRNDNIKSEYIDELKRFVYGCQRIYNDIDAILKKEGVTK